MCAIHTPVHYGVLLPSVLMLTAIGLQKKLMPLILVQWSIHPTTLNDHKYFPNTQSHNYKSIIITSYIHMCEKIRLVGTIHSVILL